MVQSSAWLQVGSDTGGGLDGEGGGGDRDTEVVGEGE